MRRALGISFATILIVAAACDEFTESAPSSTEDAGADSSSSDATSANEGGDPRDAGSDAPSIPFCNTVDATFCWSFDDTTSGSALYGPSFGKLGDAPTLTPLAKSAPNAMLAERDGSAGSTMVFRTVEPNTTISCTASIWFEEISDNTEVMTYALGGRIASFLVEPLDANAIKSSLLYDRNGPKLIKGPNLPLKQWIEIRLSGQATGSGFLLGAYAQDASVIGDFSDAGTGIFTQSPVFAVGYYAQYGGKGSVRVDDVHCSYD